MNRRNLIKSLFGILFLPLLSLFPKKEETIALELEVEEETKSCYGGGGFINGKFKGIVEWQKPSNDCEDIYNKVFMDDKRYYIAPGRIELSEFVIFN